MDQNGTPLNSFVHGPNVDEVLVDYQDSPSVQRRFPHADRLGSIVASADTAGNRLSVNTYDEYGGAGSATQGRCGKGHGRRECNRSSRHQEAQGPFHVEVLLFAWPPEPCAERGPATSFGATNAAPLLQPLSTSRVPPPGARGKAFTSNCANQGPG